MTFSMKARLSTMMFLEYFIWGAWYVTFGTWLSVSLHFTGQQIGVAAGATAVGAMVAPFLVGLMADTFFATQWVLAALHLVGAVLLFAASRTATFGSLYVTVLFYCLAFMPTLALTNSLAFRQMSDPKAEFGPVRVLGTLGWIVAGLVIGSLRWEPTARPIQLAAAASVLMAVYCFTLPATPPLARDSHSGLKGIFPREAISLLGERSMAVFAAASFLICIPLQFYYAFTNLFLNESGVRNAAGQMTGGQMSELLCMLLIPWFFRRLGVKYMLIAGMSAWVLRYVLFAFGNAGPRMSMLWIGIILHGISYDFFFVTGQIYIDRKALPALRAAAQGLITFLTYGVGMFIGSWISGAVVQHYTRPEGMHDWRAIWNFSALTAAVVLVLFAFTFRDDDRESVSRAESQRVPAEIPL